MTLFRNTRLTDSAFRLLQAMASIPPINALNSDAVAKAENMGRCKRDNARTLLQQLGHFHQRNENFTRGSGYRRAQRIVSMIALRTPEEVNAGWDAAWEAARLGKDTEKSRRLGVRILNSVIWLGRPQAHYRRSEPSPGSTVPPAAQQCSFGNQSQEHQTPLPVPRQREPEPKAPVRVPRKERPAKPKLPLPDLPELTAAQAPLLQRAEQVLLGLRRCDPPLPLTASEVRELAPLAAHHLVRGDTPQGLRNSITSSPPLNGVRAPAAYVRHRLIHYLPPVPRPTPTPPPHRAPTPPQPIPGGPADLFRRGAGRAAVFEAARKLRLYED